VPAAADPSRADPARPLPATAAGPTVHGLPSAGGPPDPDPGRPLPPRPLPPTPPGPPRPPGQVPQPAPPPGFPALSVPDPSAVPDPVLDRMLAERIVFLGGELDDRTADRVCSQLLLLAADDATRDITLYINSPGGSLTAGLAVHDTLRTIRPDVATWAVGTAVATGQFLLCAGAPGKRHALPHSRIMMRQPSAGAAGRAGDVAVRAGMLAGLRREVAELIAEHTGQDVATVIADADRDRWFTPTEARDYGIIDHIAP